MAQEKEVGLTEVSVTVGEGVGWGDAAVDAVRVPLAALPELPDRLQRLVTAGAHLDGLFDK